MGMTKRDAIAKQQTREILSEEGYPTYSYLIEDFDINLLNTCLYLISFAEKFLCLFISFILSIDNLLTC